jgi:hypothetical protein
MRLVTYDSNGKWQVGIAVENEVVDSLAAAVEVARIATLRNPGVHPR